MGGWQESTAKPNQDLGTQNPQLFYRATGQSIWAAILGCAKLLPTPEAGCKNATSFRFLHGLDSPSHWVPGWLQEGGCGVGVNLCSSPSQCHVQEESNGCWFLSSKEGTKQNSLGLGGFCPEQPKPGEPCPPLSASATSEGLAGLPEHHRFGL